MTFQHIIRGIALMVAIVALGTFTYTFVHATIYESEDSGYAPPVAAVGAMTTTATDTPVMISIPSLSIHAKVQSVGLTKSGNLGVPNNFTDVAWYKYGPAPGQNGSAVIDGHVDNAVSLPGVFKHLADIAPGADIYVIMESGTIQHFVAVERHTYTLEEFPSSEVFDKNDQPRLNLITCAGNWVQSEKMYNTRLVVYAVKAGE